MERRNAIYKKALEDLMDPAAGMSEEEKTAYKNRILAKLRDGKSLTSEEMNYLRAHEPALYRTAVRVKNKKEILKEQLKHCRSKQQADMVISQTIRAVSDQDPDKQYVIAGLRRVADKFRKSSRYARLPETDEKARKKKQKQQIVFVNKEKWEEEDEWEDMTPIRELLDELPTFDVKQ